MKMYGKTPKEAAELILKCAAANKELDEIEIGCLSDAEYERRFGWMHKDDVYGLVQDITGCEPMDVGETDMRFGEYIEWDIPCDVIWTKEGTPRKSDLRRAIKAVEKDMAKLQYLKAVCEELLKLTSKQEE